MSGLRDGLGRWAANHGTYIADNLNGAASQVEVRARVTRTRRLRAAGAAAGSLAGVVAVVLAVQFIGAPSEPTPAIAATGAPDEALRADTVPSYLACGNAWDLSQGMTLQSEASSWRVLGEWSVWEDGGHVNENPSTLWVGYESLAWEQASEGQGDPDTKVLTSIVAVKDGAIVGVGPAVEGEATGSNFGNLPNVGPTPGDCVDSTISVTDGLYDYHVVTQTQDSAGVPIATWVDPAGPITLDVSGLDEWYGESEAPDGPAALREPEGDVYQAFVVPPPDSASCTPLQDQLAGGQPGLWNIQYDVTIPGVQPIDGQAWGKAPVVVIDDPGYEAWYVGRPTALIAEAVDGGNPTASVGWTTGTTWGETDPPGTLRLINHEGLDPFPELQDPEGCAFNAPIPTVEGAVFLVIDGVDVATVEAANPAVSWAADPATLSTWVYLGQAGSAADENSQQEPEEVMYRSYVVTPADDYTSCDPVEDLHQSGQPAANSLTYNVTIPGVQPLSQEGPVAIADSSVADAWYFDLPAWLTYDNPGSSHNPSVGWGAAAYTLDYTEGPLPPGTNMDCIKTLENTPASGGVWLVIGGVDHAALGAAYPAADIHITEHSQTWVYLGELEKPSPQFDLGSS